MADSMKDQLSNLQKTLDDFIKHTSERFKHVEDKISQQGSNGSGENSSNKNRDKVPGGFNNNQGTKVTKLDFPKYNGQEDPTSWICRVEQYFDFKQIEEREKLPLAAYHLEGESQMWYQLFRDSEEVVTWNALKTALQTRYGSTSFEDHFGELTKLQQTGTVRDYQLQFEQLLSKVERLSVHQQLGCFVSGLKGEVRIEVQAGRPKSVTEAIGLARLYESRNWSLKKPPNTEERRTGSRDSAPPLPSSNLTRTRNPPTRRLSTTEMQERRARGLCFNCDEKFVPGHRCKKLFLIEGIYSAEENRGEEEAVGTEEWEEEEPVISLHALTGTPNPQTMRVRGVLGNLGLVVLMDSRSTHNFLNPQIAQRLGLRPTHSGRMTVTVANGEKIHCTGVCAGVLLWLQGEPFLVDFFILPMDVCEAVLGTQWLRTLGPIWWDFAKLVMVFQWKRKEVELRGIKLPTHRMIEKKEMDREVKRRRCGWVCHVQLRMGRHEEGSLNALELGANSCGQNHTHPQMKGSWTHFLTSSVSLKAFLQLEATSIRSNYARNLDL